MIRRVVMGGALVGALFGSQGRAGAQPRPGLTTAKGAIVVAATLEVDATAAKAAKPTSVAPDVSYGVTDGLTVLVAHSTFATTGFRGGAGKGICVTGDTRGCPSAYNNVGVEGLLSLARGPFAAALNAGVHATNLEDGFYAAKLGVRMRLAQGAFSVIASPTVLVALSERDAMKANKDQLFVPVLGMYKATKELSFGAGSGLKGPLDGLAAARARHVAGVRQGVGRRR
jgi:hypothetical protein